LSEIIKVLAQLAEGNRLSLVAGTIGHKADAILVWLRDRFFMS
jgi:hypothetical protein